MTSDTFPALYILVLTGHVETLNIRIRRLASNVTKSCEENIQDLILCIKDHQTLTQYVQKVQMVTSSGISIQFLATGTEACVIAVCFLIVKGDLFETMYLGSYFVCVILQIFLYCYFGNELINKSQRITEAIYSCNWTDQDKRFRKILLIFTQSTQTSMRIKAADYVVVSLSTFVSVMKSSYSLFALLMNVT
ncbi:unnamed protein product [Hermetia illucens]|uniref:Uncharacterized protein n=1 Tax=Hermetia illucens TaxID=343691 RepID=A0A7R8URJ0_HERIL|nr:unnamed protein product [Hermetia illucens]